MTLTIGSVFSGIAGAERGLEMAGLGPVIWQVENDPFCTRSLEKNYPKVKRFSDVRTVGATELEWVHVICAGSPCQENSVANPKGKGIGGGQSALWFELMRIVRELRPWFVAFENVPGLVRRGLERVVSDLCDADYSVVGTRLSAADAGAWHERERLFLVAYADGARKLQSQRPIENERGRAGYRTCPAWAPWANEPDIPRVAHGFPNRLAHVKALGNTCVSQCMRIVGQMILDLNALRHEPNGCGCSLRGGR